jgi:hypothetical protein
MDGDCPAGIEAVKKIRLTSDEKRAIFLALQLDIEKQAQTSNEEESKSLQRV